MTSSARGAGPQPLPAPVADPGSFRDPQSRVFRQHGRVLRALSDSALADFNALAGTRFFVAAQADGRLVGSKRLAESEAEAIRASLPDGSWAAILEHDRLPVISYPYEWSFGMLREAALLTLDLLLAALDENLTLKDASAYNVQFVGSRPVFIDVGSFTRLEPGAPWAGYLQFCQHFLYPLLLTAHKGVDFQPFLRGSLDGIAPETMSPLFRGRERFRRGVLAHVWLQARLRRANQNARAGLRSEIRSAGFSRELVIANARGLRKLVAGLAWRPAATTWIDYASTHSYTDADHAAKRAFVTDVAAARRRGVAWDLGANTGTFSRLVAPHTDVVLALEGEHATVDRLFAELARDRSTVPNVLPLVQNLADPSPGLGWRGRERPALEGRSRPDLVLALALVHHVALAANVPLADFLDWLRGLGAELVIEWVDRADPMVERLLRHKSESYRNYDVAVFERELARRFDVRARLALASGTRFLVHATPR